MPCPLPHSVPTAGHRRAHPPSGLRRLLAVSPPFSPAVCARTVHNLTRYRLPPPRRRHLEQQSWSIMTWHGVAAGWHARPATHFTLIFLLQRQVNTGAKFSLFPFSPFICLPALLSLRLIALLIDLGFCSLCVRFPDYGSDHFRMVPWRPPRACLIS